MVLAKEANAKLIMSHLSEGDLSGTIGAHTFIHESQYTYVYATLCVGNIKASSYDT